MTQGALEPHRLLTPAEMSQLADAAAESMAGSTRRAYASAWRGWQLWCLSRDVPALPGAPEQFALYLTHLANEGRSVSTIDRVVAAVRHVHEDAGLPDPGASRGVCKVREGLRRRIGTAPRRQSHPLTTAEVCQIVELIDTQSLRGCRDRAMILLWYAAAMRRSELVALRVRDIAFRSGGVSVTIARSKTDQVGEGVRVGVARGTHPVTDPVAALENWLARSGLKWSDPLFTPISWSDVRPTIRHMDGHSVARILQRRARVAGLTMDNLSGHSPRSGHATQAAENGAPADRIARTTRHRDLRTLEGYIRPAEAIRTTTSRDLGL